MTKYAPCGFDCRACEAYIATQNHNLDILKQHQQSYAEQFGKSISIAELYCDGCRSEGRKISFCFECEIRLCALQKGYETCAECKAFPCAKGKYVWKDMSESLANLKSWREQD